MVKLRMTTVDVAAEVRCLRKLIGMRCANIYDLSPKTYVIKLAKSSGVAESGESEKALVLLESGVRLHTTEFARDKSATPSGFTLKLRKRLRALRLEDVRQLGIDRIVDFQFGLGDGAHHIILELYAQGNLCLTDADYKILQLLRSWKDDEKGTSMLINQRYPTDSCRLLQRTTAERLDALVKPQSASGSEIRGEAELGVGNQLGQSENPKEGKVVEGKGTKNKNKAGGASLKSVLGEGLGYGPVLTEHIILDAGLQPELQIRRGTTSPTIAELDCAPLMESVKKFEDWLEAVAGGNLVPEGYIFMQKKSPGKHSVPASDKSETEKVQVYDEFYPLVLKQLEGREQARFETFDAAMDEFFSKVEGQRAQQQRKAQEDSALGKLEKIRVDQTQRVTVLKKEVDQSVRMAELIEYNLDDVDAAILAVRTALASGMDWKDLGQMIKEERKAGNPVAGLVHSLQLETNQITLLLSNVLDEMDDAVEKVEVDLSLGAHANARRWFETKKRHATKQEKTVASHEKAFKAAEKKTQLQLAQAKAVAAITHIRKVHWFEKFHWFISSENFLVISGRDAQQNELVVKRYMKKGDLYVHADLHGASSTVVKNHDPNNPIPPLTLNQAGCFTVCRSQAWDSKIVTSAWWVEAHQVSKTVPTGEYLTVGSFMVRGKKNFLPPHPLVMGYGFLFRLDESSLGAHLHERQVRGEDEGEMIPVIDDGSHVRDKTTDLALQEEDDIDPTSPQKEIDVLSEHASVAEEDLEDSVESVASEEDRKSAAGDNDSATDIADPSELDNLLDKALQLRTARQVSKGGSKYALEDLATGDDESHDRISELLNTSGGTQREKPYVSKAERRKLKKGVKQEGSFEVDDRLSEERSAADEGRQDLAANVDSREASATEKNEKGTESAGIKPGRGRKGKLKKIKDKYADQDEEERRLRMDLLASAGRKDSKVPSGHEKDLKSTRREQANADDARAELDLGQKVCYKCKKAGHIARDCPNEKAETKDISESPSGEVQTEAVQDNKSDESGVVQVNQDLKDSKEAGKREGMSRRAYARAAKEEIAAIMSEENVLELGDDEKEKLSELDSLTGKPNQSDVLLYAVPMCAPYNALQGYKYRVKLTPGSAKRGKAAKTAVDLFVRTQEIPAREKELLKAVTDPELVASMIGNAKITAPGLTKLKQTQKKTTKKSAVK